MKTIKGTFNSAIVFANDLDEKAEKQIRELCDQEFTSGSKIRIMPDVHAGAGCTIGTTMTIHDKVVPNMVGVDIGCGMFVCRLKKTKINFQKLDAAIRALVPSGFAIRKTPHEYNSSICLDKLNCNKHINLVRARLSIGTLGGGNHFIEINTDKKEELYLVIHSGSRNLGKQIAEHYQQRAAKASPGCNKALAYLQDSVLEEYLEDMAIAQQYANSNRRAIAQVITSEMGYQVLDSSTTVHNYIDIENMMLRKGAISAQKGEVVLIPINMRDGSILAIGKGNVEWNQSAPHGAGRLMSRKQAKEMLSLAEFKKSMTGVYTTSICKETLDEAPFAYKPIQEVINCIQPAVEIKSILKPIYNFKAAGD